jgi:hypothetical protein
VKEFSQELHDKNDWVKHLMVDILNYGYPERNARVNTNQYGIDVVTNKYSFEVEVKHNWSGPRFPYDTIHYSTRKSKFINTDTFFVTFNSEATHYFITHSSALTAQPIIQKDTSLTEWEAFFDVPVRLGYFNEVPDKLRKAYK